MNKTIELSALTAMVSQIVALTELLSYRCLTIMGLYRGVDLWKSYYLKFRYALCADNVKVIKSSVQLLNIYPWSPSINFVWSDQYNCICNFWRWIYCRSTGHIKLIVQQTHVVCNKTKHRKKIIEKNITWGWWEH